MTPERRQPDPFEATASTWKRYLLSAHWQDMIYGVEPKRGGCGIIYEIENFLERPNESVAIADMRELQVNEPHYHTGGETEVYIVLEGAGNFFVGGHERLASAGAVVITPPETAHFVVPAQDLVLAVINTPPFVAINYVALDPMQSRAEVGFDGGQFRRASRGLRVGLQ